MVHLKHPFTEHQKGAAPPLNKEKLLEGHNAVLEPGSLGEIAVSGVELLGLCHSDHLFGAAADNRGAGAVLSVL